MEEQIKNLSCSVYGISNNNDFFSIRDLNSLINATSDRKWFHLSGSNVYSTMDSFGYNILTLMSVWY